MSEKRKCLNCDKDISHRHASTRYCCYKCIVSSRAEQETLNGRLKRTCLSCDIDISNRHANTVYCSEHCARLYRGETLSNRPSNRPCKQCGTQIDPARSLKIIFCTTACQKLDYKIRMRRKSEDKAKQALHGLLYNNPDIGRKP